MFGRINDRMAMRDTDGIGADMIEKRRMPPNHCPSGLSVQRNFRISACMNNTQVSVFPKQRQFSDSADHLFAHHRAQVTCCDNQIVPCGVGGDPREAETGERL